MITGTEEQGYRIAQLAYRKDLNGENLSWLRTWLRGSRPYPATRIIASLEAFPERFEALDEVVTTLGTRGTVMGSNESAWLVTWRGDDNGRQRVPFYRATLLGMQKA